MTHTMWYQETHCHSTEQNARKIQIGYSARLTLPNSQFTPFVQGVSGVTLNEDNRLVVNASKQVNVSPEFSPSHKVETQRGQLQLV
jgi:hypothetical protein